MGHNKNFLYLCTENLMKVYATLSLLGVVVFLYKYR